VHNLGIKISVNVLFAALLVTALNTWPAENVAFEWPDSSHYWRVLVNVNQYIESRPMEWFSQDKLITDFVIRDIKPGDSGRAVQRYKTIRNLLEARGMYVGTYVSGTTVGPQADQTVYPPASVSLEQMPATARYVGSWPGQPNRKIIDVTDTDTRHAFQAGMRQMWESMPAPVRFVDNAAVHRSAGRGQPWGAYCKNMEEIRKIGEFLGSRVIFNISAHIGTLSDEETEQLMQAVRDGGVALEMPWAPAIRQSKEATERAKARYRQLLDSGMGIVMIPVDAPEDALADWVHTWRKPTDHLYISGTFWKPPNMKIHRVQ
jgi:hypothetical protein